MYKIIKKKTVTVNLLHVIRLEPSLIIERTMQSTARRRSAIFAIAEVEMQEIRETNAAVCHFHP